MSGGGSRQFGVYEASDVLDSLAKGIIHRGTGNHGAVCGLCYHPVTATTIRIRSDMWLGPGNGYDNEAAAPRIKRDPNPAGAYRLHLAICRNDACAAALEVIHGDAGCPDVLRREVAKRGGRVIPVRPGLNRPVVQLEWTL